MATVSSISESSVGPVTGDNRCPALSIVIPALDEEQRLPPTLVTIGAFLAESPCWLPAEIIVVDDGSNDQTADVSRKIVLPAEIDLTVIKHEHNLGKGAAVRTGFQRSSGHLVLLTDADLAAPIEEIDSLAPFISDKNVVIGSRAVNRDLIENPQPWYRDLMGRIFNLAVRSMVLGGIGDTQCGFKLFPGDLARALSAAQRLNGFAFDVELLVLARRWDFDLLEVGIRWRHIEASRVLPMRHSSQMLRDLLKIWLWQTFGRLPRSSDAQT